MQLKLLCIGDIVGRPGRQILAEELQHLTQEHEIDCTIVNAENAAGGSGITASICDKLRKYGVNLITLGDHIYRKRDIVRLLTTHGFVVRSAEYITAPMDVVKNEHVKKFLRSTIFRSDITSFSILSTAILINCTKGVPNENEAIPPG